MCPGPRTLGPRLCADRKAPIGYSGSWVSSTPRPLEQSAWKVHIRADENDAGPGRRTHRTGAKAERHPGEDGLVARGSRGAGEPSQRAAPRGSRGDGETACSGSAPTVQGPVVILVDTSVWIDHLRRGNERLKEALRDEGVLCHPFVIGELACGHLTKRHEILSLLRALPQAHEVEHEEAIAFLEAHRLSGAGLGWIDVHLLASAVLSGARLWTLDARLKAAARARRVDLS